MFCLNRRTKLNENLFHFNMWKVTGLIVSLCLIISLQQAQAQDGTSSVSTSSVSSSSVSTNLVSPKLVKSINSFTRDLYNKVIYDTKDNFLISPISAQACLALLYCGAGGWTATQMGPALDFLNQTQHEVANEYKGLMASLQGKNVEMANGIFINDRYSLRPSYKRTAVDKFSAIVKRLNFYDPTGSADYIDRWVENKTANMIKNVISPDAITDYTDMILVNTLYLKNEWINSFDPSSTSPQPFYNGKCIKKNAEKVPMMNQINEFKYGFYRNLKSQVLQMPLLDRYSMVVVLPKDCDGLFKLSEMLLHYDLEEIVAQELQYTPVEVNLPKFTINYNLNLNDILKRLGFDFIFNNEANFSKIFKGDVHSHVSNVFQKTHIEVNEVGVTAAAATVGSAMVSSSINFGNKKPVQFNANHPFVFALMKDDQMLFIGNFMN